MRAIVNALARIEHEQKSSNASQNSFQKKNLLVGIVGVCVILLYTTATFYQVYTMRQQLEATEAAVIFAEAAWIDEPPGGTWPVGIKIRNFGRGPAHKVHGTFRVVPETLPDETRLGAGYVWNINIGELPSPTPWGDLGPSTINVEQPIKVSPSDAARIGETQETLEISGEIAFDNGFRQRREPICFRYLSVTIRNKDGIIRSGPDKHALPCYEFERQMRTLLELKREAAGKP